MSSNTLQPREGDHQLHNYEELASDFDWSAAEKAFSWHETGKVNMAYEAIDRHAESNRKNKVALYYKDDKRQEEYTFQDMKEMTNKADVVILDRNLGKVDADCIKDVKVDTTIKAGKILFRRR